MHPDTVIAGLRRELETAPQRAKEIEKEIAHWNGKDRPPALTADQTPVADRDRGYLDALKEELQRVSPSEKSRIADIKAEIRRVRALIDEKVLGKPAPEPELDAPADTSPDPDASAEGSGADATADAAAGGQSK